MAFDPRRLFLPVLMGTVLLAGSGSPALDEASQKFPRFESDIRPIFEAN